MGHGYYDRAGNPITLQEWAVMIENDGKQKIVARNDVNGLTFSTVWLGLDHSFSDDGPPIIFETMIFGMEDGEPQWRYATEEEALEFHAKLVAAANSGASEQELYDMNP